MKFYLAQDAPINIMQTQNDGVPNITPFRMEVDLDKIYPVMLGNSFDEDMKQCTKLKQRLVVNSGWGRSELDWEAVSHEDRWAGVRILSGPVTNALIELFGSDVKIQMKFTMYIFQEENVESEEMKVKGGQIYACDQVDEEEFKDLRLADIMFAGKLTVIVNINSGSGSGTKVADTQGLRNMLHEELGSDLAIILENGKEVRAHKGMLMARSDVFKAMFLQEDTKEAQSSTVKIPEISEEAARALLAYIYCFDDSVPKSKPMVAFEMFRVGHKYNFSVVETAMKQLLTSKPADWFDADVALELFHFAKKLPEDDGNPLKMKAVKVMKANFEKFKQTDAFVSLFNEEPELAMEICAHFAAL